MSIQRGRVISLIDNTAILSYSNYPAAVHEMSHARPSSVMAAVAGDGV
jgi:hypothetical protein